jgi:hypothetical protein
MTRAPTGSRRRGVVETPTVVVIRAIGRGRMLARSQGPATATPVGLWADAYSTVMTTMANAVARLRCDSGT